jgi:hypothetical protein
MNTVKKHSKFKNTGILFELLIRQVTSDMITNQDSKAVRIVKKYFSGDTELLKEYNLYSAILKAPVTTEAKAESLINAVLQESKKLDTDLLNKEKYALIKEIKRHYDVENFFKAKISNYKASAAIYTLFEATRLKNPVDTSSLINNRLTLLEHITKETVTKVTVEKKAAQEFIKEDEDIRILAYRLIVEKYNEAYANLSEDQKEILKEYINNVSDTKQLKEYLNAKIDQVRKELAEQAQKVEDKVVKIKLKEVISLIKPLTERQAIKDDHLLSLMQYYELVKELKANK